MKVVLLVLIALGSWLTPARATVPAPASQRFDQEIATRFTAAEGAPKDGIQLIEIAPNNSPRAFAGGQWFELREGCWTNPPSLRPSSGNEFLFPNADGEAIRVQIPSAEVKQLLRYGRTNFLVTTEDVFAITGANLTSLRCPSGLGINQIALSPEGTLVVASRRGLFRQLLDDWDKLSVLDHQGRGWGLTNVLGTAFDATGRLWFATRAGVVCQTRSGWQFYEGKDGLPWNEFTGICAGRKGDVWFGTARGAIHFDGRVWQYRQGPAWLPHDDIRQVSVDAGGQAWFATAGGIGSIGPQPMTLAQKANRFEEEIERYIQRTSFGYVAEAHLRIPADRASADPQDSDNDGLWTAMYGAGECFAYGATHDPRSKARAKKSFEALRFLQTVTQGGPHAPPPGYIARTIRPAEWPDPNPGQLDLDRATQKHDALWKAYEPRWPKSADGKWFWKSDTSSDELDGHYFFYALYFDLCAETAEERDRVREVVRGITDHLVTHQLALMDHDGTPTRWAVYGPQFLNQNPLWWPERGLNSLSILSYLAVATHVTGDAKYDAISRDLIDHHGYAHNAMYPKVQHGPGSGNQSDDEMAFMCYYSLLRCSKDDVLLNMLRTSFFQYWVNEAPEMNPFFNFTYAACNSVASVTNVWGSMDVQPWPDWHEDAMATLRGLPLDRLNWPHLNSHRLDLARLPRVRSSELDSPDRPQRGFLVNGKVLPVENRHFNHWNTDPWTLDYGGSGDELAAGTVFLLPYYMGLYHGFIERPNKERVVP